MCCQTHTPAYVFKGSLLAQAEEEAFRCRCPCLGCPRRATGEDQRCAVCRNPAAVASWERLPPWAPADSGQAAWYPVEAGGEGLPGGRFPVVNGVAQPRRWDSAGVIRLEPQAFAADNFHVEPGLPLA